jgi:hypothetical protein
MNERSVKWYYDIVKNEFDLDYDSLMMLANMLFDAYWAGYANGKATK